MGKILKVGILISGKISSSVKTSADKAVKSQGRVGSAIRKVNSQFAQAKSARKYGKLLGELKKKQRGLGRSSARLDKGIAEVERRYHEARRAASRYGSKIGEVTRKQKRLNEANAKGGIGRRGIGTAIATAGGAGLGLSIRSGMLAQEEGAYLRTVINTRDGNRDAAVGRSIKQARAFARKSLASETEILKIEYALNSAGLDEEVSRAGARISHMVAKVTRGNSEQVAEIIGTAYNNLGDQLTGTADEKIKQIGSILTKTQFQYQIRDFGQLGESMKMASATASSYKISLDQTAAAVGFLNSAGFQGTRGGTAFQAMMRNMTKAGEELGFSMVRGADGSLDLMATLTGLGASLDGMGIDEKADTIGRIFGDEGKGAVIAYIKDLDKLKTGYDNVAKAAKSNLVDEEYARFSKLAAGQWKILTQNIGQLATVIGSKLLPVLTPVMGVAGKIIGALAWGLDNIPGVGLAVGVLATVVVGLGSALAVATTATWAWNFAMKMSAGPSGRAVGAVLNFSKRLWGLARLALPAAITGIKILGRALLFNPIGLAITAIAGGAFLIIKYWKPIKAFFGGIWTKIQAPVKKTWALFKAVFAWSPAGLLIRGFGGAFKAVRGFVRSPGVAAKKTWGLLKGVFAWSPIGLLTRGFGSAFKVVRGFVRSPGVVAKKTWGLLKSVFSWSPVGLLTRGFGPAFKAVRGFVRSPGAVAKKTWGLLKSVFSWSPIGLAKRGWDALPGVYKSVMGKIVGIAKIAMGKVKDFLLAPIKLVGTLWGKIRGKGKKPKQVNEAKPGDAINDNAPVMFGKRPPPSSSPILRIVSQPVNQAPTPVVRPTPKPRPPAPYIPRRPDRVQSRTPQGDNIFNIYISGTVDAENLVRQIRPELQRVAQEQREARFHD